MLFRWLWDGILWITSIILIVRCPYLVGFFLGFVLIGGFLVVFLFWFCFAGVFFSHTARLKIYDTCPQGHTSTLFQDINCKSYSTEEVTVARRYHEKIMGNSYRFSLPGFKSFNTANFKEMGACEKTMAANLAPLYILWNVRGCHWPHWNSIKKKTCRFYFYSEAQSSFFIVKE